MNTQINPRTFTDQVSAYYEKTRFLQDLGRQDLARIHDYFFYKRLLLFYGQLYDQTVGQADRPASMERKAQSGERNHQEAYLAEIENILRRDEDRVRTAFGDPIVDSRDRKKAELFLKSPERYCRRVQWEERVVIPLKVKVKSILKRFQA